MLSEFSSAHAPTPNLPTHSHETYPPIHPPTHPSNPPKQFVIKTTIAATMFPHLSQRLFAGRNASVVRSGLAVMGFTFFVVQLSSMITGW